MKQDKFINVLKKVINEEVRTVIKQELTEILKKGLEPTVQEIQESSKKEVIQKKSNSINNKVKFKENKFSNILNETPKLTETNTSSDYASLMSEDIVMTSKDAAGFNMLKQTSGNQLMKDPETGKTMKVDPIIQKAMNRDYSALMTAIDKKKGNGIPIRQ